MNFRAILIAGCLFSACNHQPEKSSDKAVASKDIFPLASFIEGQVHLVDSLKPPIAKFSTNKNIIDTAIIEYEEFRKLASDFVTPDISQSNCDDCYEENNFSDQSIGAVTLTYTALKKDLTIRRVDVIVKPGSDGNDKVKSVYVEKIVNREDSSINSKLFWKTGKYFQIITNIIRAKEAPLTRHIKVVWDPTDS